jgi:hypothetical protein
LNNRRGLCLVAPEEGIAELQSVYLYDKLFNDSTWRPLQVYNIPNIDPKRLQDIICGKEIKFAHYQQFDQMWLLIVIDFMNMAQDQNIVDFERDLITVSKFDKVFLFKTCLNQIVEFRRNC